MNRTFSARIVCPRQLFVGFLFACLSNFSFAGWEEATATTAQLKKQFSAVATKSLATDSPNQLKRKPTPRVSQFLSELGTAEARAMLGAFNASYSIIKKKEDGFILAKESQNKGVANGVSVVDVEFIISFNFIRKNKSNKSFKSVITQGGFDCKLKKLALWYQQFHEESFGTGDLVSAHESRQPATFRKVSIGLSDFLSAVYCRS